MESQHEGIKYQCNYCDHQATRKNHLKTHVQTKHADIIKKSFNGKQVEEKEIKEAVVDVNKEKTNAKKSKKPAGQWQYKKELFVKCTDCEGVFASRGLMLKHHEARHQVKLSDLILSCDQCDYQTKWVSNYHRHRRTHNVTV